MEYELIEYVRKSGRKPKRDDDGKIIVKGKGAGRQKKGVLYCGVSQDDPDCAIVGFSMCSVMDQFDYVNGQYEQGFGLELAKQRADKWSTFTGYFVQNSWTEEQLESDNDLIKFVNPNSKTVVEVPPSLIKTLTSFVQRCRRYFQDKKFPEWVERVENGDEENVCDFINLAVDFEEGAWSNE